MPGPGYQWACKRCSSTNHPDVAVCATCGFPAVIAPQELEPPRESRAPDHFLKEPATYWVMFPEMPIAAILVLVAPFWAISLLVNHHPVAAVLLVVGVGVCGYLTFLAARANEKWGAH